MEHLERDFDVTQCDFCEELRKEKVRVLLWKERYTALLADYRLRQGDIKELQERLLEYTRGFTDFSENTDDN